MLQVREISKRFGRVQAVQSVSFGLERGEVVGLLGPNGAGKSTTIRTIAGLVAPDRGSVVVNGIDAIASPKQAKAHLGYLPESAPLHPEMRASAYLMYRAALAHLPRRHRKSAIASVADRCRITDVLAARLGHLSKGYRQRIGLASALLADPAVLMLDEPTDGLDPSQVRLTRDLLAAEAPRRATLFSSHVLPEVERACHRVIIIAGGQVLADDAPDRLISQHGGTAEVEVEARASSQELRRRIASVPGIKGAQASEPKDASPWTRARALLDPRRQDARDLLAEALSGITVRTLTVRQPTLEDVYTRLVDAARPGVRGDHPSKPEGVPTA